MRYTHEIQTTTDPISDQADDHDGTAADYGRTVLTQWIEDEQLEDSDLADRDGNALIRVAVSIDGDAIGTPAATIEYGDPPVPPTS